MATENPQDLQNEPRSQQEQESKIVKDSMGDNNSASRNSDRADAENPTTGGDRSVEYVLLLKKHLDFVEGEFQSLKHAQRCVSAPMIQTFDQTLIP